MNVIMYDKSKRKDEGRLQEIIWCQKEIGEKHGAIIKRTI